MKSRRLVRLDSFGRNDVVNKSKGRGGGGGGDFGLH